MKIPVPYLARLARQAAGDPVLRPPSQLVSGGTSITARSPGHHGSLQPRTGHATTPEPFASLPLPSGEEQPPVLNAAGFPAAEGATGQPAAGLRAEVVLPGEPAAAAPSPAPPAAAAPADPAAGTLAATASAGLPRPPRLRPDRPSAASPEFPAAADGDLAHPPDGRPVPPLAEPGPVSPRHTASTGDTAPARSPRTWPSALWAGPVDLPETIGPAPVTGEAEPQDGPSSPAGLAAPPSPPRPAPPASWHQDQRRDDAGPRPVGTTDARAAPGATDDAEPGRASEPPPVRDLLPPLIAEQGPAAASGAEPGEQRREPQVPRPRVSIGTIEVTVVPPPPAPVAPAAGAGAPAAQALPRWPGPSARPAVTAGADRLRDGVRRWYGTAQG
jgi:hypothetical protein